MIWSKLHLLPSIFVHVPSAFVFWFLHVTHALLPSYIIPRFSVQALASVDPVLHSVYRTGLRESSHLSFLIHHLMFHYALPQSLKPETKTR